MKDTMVKVKAMWADVVASWSARPQWARNAVFVLAGFILGLMVK